MSMIMNLMMLVVGFVFLIKGADVFVDGASATARRFKVSKMLIGLTIVAFGTSAPEFAVSVKSLLAGNGDMLLGNVIGSNILNILLILGSAAMFRSLKVSSNTVKKELPVMILVTLAFATLLLDELLGGSGNAFTRQDGLILVLFFAVFIYYLIGMAKQKAEVEKNDQSNIKLGRALLMVVGGIFGIVLGSNLVVDGASNVATMMGVSQRMIALSIVALGTSLPELVTSIVATRKGEIDIAIGNVVGSNIFNLGIVAGLPVFLIGGVQGVGFSQVDVAVMILAAVLLLIFTKKDKKIDRREGIVLLLIFVIYYGYVLMGAQG